MRSLLLAGSLLLGIAGLSGMAGQTAAGQTATAVYASPTDQAGESWKAEVLKPLDIEMGDNGPDGARRISVVFDRTALLNELPRLQEHGALSTSIAGDDVEKHPASYANVLALLLTSWRVRDLYATDPALGATRWKVSAADGDRGVREMFSFSFDRVHFASLPWDQLPFTDFPRAAPGFSYNLRFTVEMSHEVDGTIADD